NGGPDSRRSGSFKPAPLHRDLPLDERSTPEVSDAGRVTHTSRPANQAKLVSSPHRLTPDRSQQQNTDNSAVYRLTAWQRRTNDPNCNSVKRHPHLYSMKSPGGRSLLAGDCAHRTRKKREIVCQQLLHHAG